MRIVAYILNPNSKWHELGLCADSSYAKVGEHYDYTWWRLVDWCGTITFEDDKIVVYFSGDEISEAVGLYVDQS